MSKSKENTEDKSVNDGASKEEVQEVLDKLEQESQEQNTDTDADAGNESEEEDKIDTLSREVKDLKDQNLRLYAEFENYRKRTSRERMELFGTANQELMTALLPVLDDFQRALKNMDKGDARDGVQLIYSKLENTLKNKGLKRMEASSGKEFNVDTMEAVTRIPAPDKKMKGKVVDEIEPGYMLGNKILRYAKVVVGE